MPSRLEPPPKGSYRLVCPYCDAQEDHLISRDNSVASCRSCGKVFRVLIATVRAKRGKSRSNGREYIIRTIMRIGERALKATSP